MDEKINHYAEQYKEIKHNGMKYTYNVTKKEVIFGRTILDAADIHALRRLLFEIEGDIENQYLHFDDLICDSEVSVRCCNCCSTAGIDTWRDLVNYGIKRMTGIRNCGKRSVWELREKLKDLGMGKFLEED